TVAALHQVNVVELWHFCSPGAKIRVFNRIDAAPHFHAPAERSANFLAGFALILDGAIVVPVESLAFLKFEPLVYAPDDGRLKGDAKDVSAEVENFGSDILVSAVD